MAEKEQRPTAEALKQRRKREKAALKDAALGVEKFTVEVAGVFKADLKRLMKQYGLNKQQEVFQNLLRNVIAADFEAAAQMLNCVTTPVDVTEEVSRIIRAAGLKAIQKTSWSSRCRLFIAESLNGSGYHREGANCLHVELFDFEAAPVTVSTPVKLHDVLVIVLKKL